MIGRTFSSTSRYRYGFNGKENDPETSTQDYGMRIYNPSLGRFLSVDPLWGDYPQLTTYQFASNRPIDGTDLDGLEYVTVHIRLNKDGTRTEICRDNHYLEMSRAQIQEVHGDPDKFYKKYSAAFEKEGRGVKYVYYNNVDGQDVLSKKKPTWESRQHAAAPWNPEAKFRRHGIWAGSGGITILGAEGKLPNMDKSFGYIDQIDKLAKAHDEFYDYAGYEDKDWRRNFSDNAIAADQALVDGFKDYAKKVDDSRDKEGNITYVDPVTGRAASEEAYETAKKAGDYFEKIIKEKQDKKANKASTKHNKK